MGLVPPVPAERLLVLALVAAVGLADSPSAHRIQRSDDHLPAGHGLAHPCRACRSLLPWVGRTIARMRWTIAQAGRARPTEITKEMGTPISELSSTWELVREDR